MNRTIKETEVLGYIEKKENFPADGERFVVGASAHGRYFFAWGNATPYAMHVPTYDATHATDGIAWHDTLEAAREDMRQTVEAWEGMLPEGHYNPLGNATMKEHYNVLADEVYFDLVEALEPDSFYFDICYHNTILRNAFGTDIFEVVQSQGKRLQELVPSDLRSDRLAREYVDILERIESGSLPLKEVT